MHAPEPLHDVTRLAFYPGCLVLQRMPEYEAATRAVLETLGIELVLVQEATCCGSPVVESFTRDWVYLAAYNLALIEAMGHRTVVTVCGGCTNTLTRAARILREEPQVRAEANRRLEKIGLSVTGEVEPVHLIRLLTEKEKEVQARLTRSLSLRVALTNPCQVFRPGTVMLSAEGAEGEGGRTPRPLRSSWSEEDPMAPHSLRRLVELTGAEVVEYGGEDECCGATLYLADPDLALAAGRRKLEAVQEADLLLHACGNCHLLLRRFQRKITHGEASLRKQALLLPQLIGLAMGLPAERLGLREGTWG